MRRTTPPPAGTALATAVALTGALTGAVAVAVATLVAAAAPAHGGEDAGRLELSPAQVVPGEEVAVTAEPCGADGSATGDASAVGAGTFSMAPDALDAPDAQDSGQGKAEGRFEVPPSAQPGTYEIVATCADGDRRVAGDLVVTLAGTRMAPAAHPRGSVKTGVGGALGPDPVQTAAGVVALAVAAAGGTWLLHRRARGDGI
ncbi:hypothetical protein [Streptomyces capitiformicae]|uniref:Integral membrane protein n=1 Tax=Streptomyces capitiformicae TaxID=2014920 RepID=A0A919L605_9ACTN|nr:hypothetical protein [Streptomyces capitiformicae]GHH83951.1 hypothetical protein GCM10017771_11910 [Streptomyces capitiformicae]